MSSETSTKRVPAARPAADGTVSGFQPWHLFLIGALLASTAGAIAVRGTRPANVVFVCLTILAAGVAAYAAFRTLWPLAQPGAMETPEMLGGRTRAALEREKTLALRAIKELEFDRAMGKVSESDWQEMTARLRNRAMRLIRQLDSGSAAYRELIEKELAARQASGRKPGQSRKASAGAPVAGLLLAAAVVGGLLVSSPAYGQMGGTGGPAMGMPDAKAMSGIPRPSETVPTGSVSVRLVRGQISNLITGHPVEFNVNGTPQAVKTDETGHAVLGGLATGTTVRAVAVVDGERLESQEFQVPAQGGVVLMLVATDKTAAEQMAKAAVAGDVVLGGQTRIITQFEDEVLQVFYLLDVVNAGQAPVKPVAPLVFEVPKGAQSTTVMEGSTAFATAKGSTVTMTGPFPPGMTTVEVAFSLPPADTIPIRLTLPTALSQVTVIAQKVGNLTLASSQMTSLRESTESGKSFLLATGPGLRKGDVLAFDLNGLPHEPTWPRYLALLIGCAVLALGAWGAVKTGGRTASVAAREQLERRREQVFDAILVLDAQRKPGAADEESALARRGELVAELERIYGELDTESAGPRGDQGLAA
jgi:hypothetical protein